MIAIAPIRTRRITAELHELTVGDVIHLCALPEKQGERGASELLKRIVEPVDRPRVGQVTDPRLWTVQERAFVIAHYIAHIIEGDDPDYAIGNGKYSDYLLDGADSPPDPVHLGTVAEDVWSIHPLLGAHAESIERLVISGRLAESRAGWWFGAMAAQLVRAGETPFDVVNSMDAALDDFIDERTQILKAFPESDFMALLHAFLVGHEKLAHLLNLEFINDGIAFMPAKEVSGLSPARFPFSGAISERAAQVFGRPE